MMPKQLMNNSDITAWLDQQGVTNYELVEQSGEILVNVCTGVFLTDRKLKSIPVQFGHVEGDFYVGHNRLTNLVGSPQTVSGNFDCEHNFLTTLLGAPTRVGRSFFCGSNRLKSLKHSPIWVGAHYCCNNNNLESLQGGPEFVSDTFLCLENFHLGHIQDMHSFSEVQKVIAQQNAEAEKMLLESKTKAKRCARVSKL